MSDDLSFAGKAALVTGSSSGAGAAIALALARLGATIAVHSRNRVLGPRPKDYRKTCHPCFGGFAVASAAATSGRFH